MSNTIELKVGDVVSYETDNPALEGDWYCVSIKDIDTLNDFRTSVVLVGRNWQRGIHPSLFPEGWQLVPIEPTDEMRYAASWASGIGGDLES